MKRFLTIIMCMLLCVSMVSPAFAQESVASTTCSPSSNVVKIGEEVEIVVSLSNCVPIRAMGLQLAYDSELFEVVSAEWTVSGAIIANYDASKGTAALAYTAATDINGDIFTFTLKAKDTAQLGETEVGLTSVSIKNASMADVACSSSTANVSIVCGHESKTEVPAKSPDCLHPGNNLYYTCAVCGVAFKADGVTETTVEAETIAALGHDYKETVTAPTCTEQGYTTHTCSRCDDSYVDTYVDALDHEYVVVVTKPTCTEQGYTTHTCSRCKDSYVDTYVDALGHSFGDWVVTTEPTCMEKGEETRTCSACGQNEIRDVDALGHNYVDVVTDTTCT